MNQNACRYCFDAPPPPEQFYETKLFRVIVARETFGDGHVIVIPKRHDPHFYSFTPDDIEEFGYLLKKVTFWAMRLTQAFGFTMLMNDGTPEQAQKDHLEIHILPRRPGDMKTAGVAQSVAQQLVTLDDAAVQKTVKDLQSLMQLPQA
ncbi:MAG: HIT domain-containing protein [Candidatus Kerfeldbacteria bacterium]|nr:HIT domain-containing protein [Candidatus Kerfeldbacteria bacterium]